ncbi:ATP-binding protein [Lichenicoccus sp.]|uniref:ATP-binding protein n=1 Tax=Lichenicoccus sp. TaxID=2781899 RepID=UPI003D0DD321
MNSQVTQLRVGDESFLVASMIDRCPKSMMLRELVRNAIEAAQTAPDGARRVELSGIVVDGAGKLAIWNTGRGMTADELFRMCDIASSIRKQNSLEQNFGMGAKVASLPSNRCGMRYRSCREGRVHEVLIGQRNGVYGRLKREVPGRDGLHDVLDVTVQAEADGRSLLHDWTEVVLLGNRVGQDTLSDPYDGAPGMVAYWVAEELAKKFFRLPDDVEVILHPGATVAAASFRFRSIAERLGAGYDRYESVTAGDGIVVHYIFDGFLPGSETQTCAGAGMPYFVHGAAGLVHRDEVYDLAWNQDWLHLGPVFGIPFCGRNISVFVEFPDDFAVLPDGYRQFLRHRDGLQQQVSLRAYAALVAGHRPAWLVALIQQHAPDSAVSPEITAALAQLLRDLRVPRRTRPVPRPGPIAATPAADAQAPADAAAVPEPEPSPPGDDAAPGEPGSTAAAAEPAAPEVQAREEVEEVETDEDDFEPAPQIVMLREPTEVAARGLAERGARYYPETHQLFVNCLYAAVPAMQSVIEREFGWALDQGTVRRHALHSAEQSLVERVGRMLVFALSKHATWAGWEMGHALSTQALTLAADDHHQSLPAARAALRAALRLRQLTVSDSG